MAAATTGLRTLCTMLLGVRSCFVTFRLLTSDLGCNSTGLHIAWHCMPACRMDLIGGPPACWIAQCMCSMYCRVRDKWAGLRSLKEVLVLGCKVSRSRPSDSACLTEGPTEFGKGSPGLRTHQHVAAHSMCRLGCVIHRPGPNE